MTRHAPRTTCGRDRRASPPATATAKAATSTARPRPAERCDMTARVEALEAKVAAVYELLTADGREPKVVGTAPTARLVG